MGVELEAILGAIDVDVSVNNQEEAELMQAIELSKKEMQREIIEREKEKDKENEIKENEDKKVLDKDDTKMVDESPPRPTFVQVLQSHSKTSPLITSNTPSKVSKSRGKEYVVFSTSLSRSYKA
jgi:hypothetical protein